MPAMIIDTIRRWSTRYFGSRPKAAVLVAALLAGGLVPAGALAQTVGSTTPWVSLPETPLFAEAPTENKRPAVDASFSQLFRDIGNDFKSFPTRQNFLWLAVGGGLSGLSHEADDNLTAQLSSSRAVGTLQPGKVIGGALTQAGAAFATYGIGRLVDSPTTAAVGADLIRAQVLTQGITQGVKLLAGRTRPDGTSLSFPSGHTASAFATGTVLQRHFGWKVGIPAYGLAAYVGASRLSENRHYLSDVIFGATLGVLAGRQVTVSVGRTRFAITPQAVPGGAGIALVKIGG